MFLVDSHCHLDKVINDINHKNLNKILQNAEKNNVKFMLSVSTSIENYLKYKNFFKKYKNIGCTCGIHPVDIKKYDYNLLYKISSQKTVLALGETGLDYFYNTDKKEYQKESLRNHIKIAKDLKKPIIIHTRCARKDTISILYEEKYYKGIIHCFSEDRETAKKFLDMGFYISFSGIITFKNAEIIRESVRFVPINRLLIETDSPYLSPVPYRGKKNQPSWIVKTLELISKLKNISIDKVAEETTKNFFTLFKLKI